MDLFLFSVVPSLVHDVVAAGASGAVVDWERRGKHRRQLGEGTQINEDTPGDLAAVRAATGGRVLCRINAWGPWSPAEVDMAVDLGADEVLLPMVGSVQEVDRALSAVDRRCGLGVLLETRAGVAVAGAVATRPLTRVYVGLNDLRIDRGSSLLFEPLVDGSVDAVRAQVSGPDFGVAGLTVPGGGHPVPSRLLAGELVRLAADFTFLRRSFLADAAGQDPGEQVARVLDGVSAAALRGPAEVAADRAELVARVGGPVRVPA